MGISKYEITKLLGEEECLVLSPKRGVGSSNLLGNAKQNIESLCL